MHVMDNGKAVPKSYQEWAVKAKLVMDWIVSNRFSYITWVNDAEHSVGTEGKETYILLSVIISNFLQSDGFRTAHLELTLFRP